MFADKHLGHLPLCVVLLMNCPVTNCNSWMAMKNLSVLLGQAIYSPALLQLLFKPLGYFIQQLVLSRLTELNMWPIDCTFDFFFKKWIARYNKISIMHSGSFNILHLVLSSFNSWFYGSQELLYFFKIEKTTFPQQLNFKQALKMRLLTSQKVDNIRIKLLNTT